MYGFGLLVGHMVGDFILQCDWMAANKSKNHLACFCHCLTYTLGVFVFNSYWLPPAAFLWVFLTHYLVDRYRLAFKLMHINGQEGFATGMFKSWSVVVVDQTLHLATLFAIGLGLGNWAVLAPPPAQHDHAMMPLILTVLVGTYATITFLSMYFGVRPYPAPPAKKEDSCTAAKL